MGLGSILGSNLSDKDRMKSELTGQDPTYYPIYVKSNDILKHKIKQVKGTTRTYNEDNDVLIWGHPTKGIWGTNKWGTKADAFEDDIVVFTQTTGN